MTPEIALAICRAASFASTMTVYGASGFIGWIAPERLGRDIAGSFILLIAAAVVVGLFSILVWLPIETATIEGSWRSVLDRHTFELLLFGTSIGLAWAVRVGLSLLLVMTALFWRSAAAVRATLSGLLLASFSFGGHANMDDGVRGHLHILNDVMHLLAAGAWLGSLVVLPACLQRLGDPALFSEARTALRRFSSVGHLAVALVITTGVCNSVLTLGRWPTNFGSTYQLLLATKIALVAIMTALALFNRYIFVPRMRSHREQAIKLIRKGTFAELDAGIVVVGLVSVFGLLDPQ
jgi:putative copper resistance protein D